MTETEQDHRLVPYTDWIMDNNGFYPFPHSPETCKEPNVGLKSSLLANNEAGIKVIK